MRVRILIVLILLAGAYYVYDAFVDYQDRQTPDSLHESAADEVRGRLP